jgi:SWI/SNF-related matrix-associated actin-dependent regulator of chromatin subfamily A3
MERLLQQEGITSLVFEGSLNEKQRKIVLETFCEHERPRVLLMTLGCGSEGLNLTVANHVIFADPWWNPMVEMQGEARVHRLKQKKDCYIYNIWCKKTIEEHVAAIRNEKKLLASILNFEENSSDAAIEDLKNLGLLRQSGQWYHRMLLGQDNLTRRQSMSIIFYKLLTKY